MRLWIRHLIWLLPVALFACGGGDSPTDPNGPSNPDPPGDPIVVIVAPTEATIGAAESIAITASVQNAAEPAVTWTAAAGQIDGTGATVTFEAPIEGGAYDVTATSVEDDTKSATATVTVTPVQVSVDPSESVLPHGGQVDFTATVTGTTVSTQVTWEASCGALTLNGDVASYTAPGANAQCQVTATSVLDSSAAATADVTVRELLIVTTADDVDDGSCDAQHCSLREAINVANAAPDADTIYLEPAAVSAPPPGRTGSAEGASAARGFDAPGPARVTTALGGPLPVITTDLTLIGAGSETTVLDAGGSEGDPRRGLRVDGPVTVGLIGFTIENGVSAGNGGGLWVGGAATVTGDDVRVRNSRSLEGFGGGVAVEGPGSAVMLTGSSIEGNEASGQDRAGGGIALFDGASLYLTESSVRSNTVVDGGGGGIFADGFQMIRLDRVDVVENLTTSIPPTATDVRGGGGIRARGAGTVLVDGGSISDNAQNESFGAAGFAFFEGVDATFTGTRVHGNTSTFRPGGGHIEESTITLVDVDVTDNFPGGLEIHDQSTVSITRGEITGNAGAPGFGTGLWLFQSAGEVEGTLFGGGQVVAIDNQQSTLALSGVAVTNHDDPDGYGHGIISYNATLEMTSSVVSGNTGDRGAGIVIYGGTATIIDSEIAHNAAESWSGGIEVREGAEVLIERSLIHGNTAGSGGGIGVFEYFVSGTGFLPSFLTVRNSTISANRSLAQFGSGGAIFNESELTLEHVSIVGNSAVNRAGGLDARHTGLVSFKNALLVGNTSGEPIYRTCAQSFPAEYIESLGGNVADDDSCPFDDPTDQVDTDAMVDPNLSDNGGATMTHALQAGSAAIGAAVVNGVVEDQRGYARDDDPDSGAFEYGAGS